MARKEKDGKKTVYCRIESSLHSRLLVLSEMTNRPIAHFVEEAVRASVKGYDDDIDAILRIKEKYGEGNGSVEAEEEEEEEEDGTSKPALTVFCEPRLPSKPKQCGQTAWGILLCAYYLQFIEGKDEFHIDDVGPMLSVIGIEPPQQLAYAIGELRRKRRWLDNGSKRGYYRVAENGDQLVKPHDYVPPVLRGRR